MDKSKILVAEDDVNLGALLKQYLIIKGYLVDLVADGEIAYTYFMKKEYDLCILDIMMPKIDGFTLAKKIKNIHSQMPIIFLTAKSFKEDVIHGFEIGADDYITKPFEMEEVLVRVEAVLRRTKKKTDKITNYEIGKYQFDTVSQQLYLEGKVTKLTSKEAELLQLLIENKNNLVERNYALKKIWGDDSIFNARSMDVYITKLRKYLQEDENIKIINVHSKGFKIVVD